MIILPLTRLSLCHTQGYIDRRYSLNQIIRWIIDQTGPIHMEMSTYSISEEFLNWLVRMKHDRLIRSSSLIIDHRSAAKSIKLSLLLQNSFNQIYYTNNHSKVTLLHNEQYKVMILSSQNQTRGGRLECGIISTLPNLYDYFNSEFRAIKKESIKYEQNY